MPCGWQRPELELENLAISAMGYGTVKTTYDAPATAHRAHHQPGAESQAQRLYALRPPAPETSGASQDDIQTAEASQPLEFPRGDDTAIFSQAIRVAEYEIAHSLLDGKYPELELENLAVMRDGLWGGQNQLPSDCNCPSNTSSICFAKSASRGASC